MRGDETIIEHMKRFANGNTSEVYSDGRAVYRSLKPHSPTIHRLLLHLEQKNIAFTPRFLGVNERRQEILSFVGGQTHESCPISNDMGRRIETVRAAAKMLKRYHDATADFRRGENDGWFLEYRGELEPEVICHNDFAPYNVTFDAHIPVGLIDFDTACPAPRIWDVAYAAYRFVPLGAETYLPDRGVYRRYSRALDGRERGVLLKSFLDAYGIEQSRDLTRCVILRLQALRALFDEQCRNGNPAFIAMRKDGHQTFYRGEIEFIKENMPDWL